MDESNTPSLPAEEDQQKEKVIETPKNEQESPVPTEEPQPTSLPTVVVQEVPTEKKEGTKHEEGKDEESFDSSTTEEEEQRWQAGKKHANLPTIGVAGNKGRSVSFSEQRTPWAPRTTDWNSPLASPQKKISEREPKNSLKDDTSFSLRQQKKDEIKDEKHEKPERHEAGKHPKKDEIKDEKDQKEEKEKKINEPNKVQDLKQSQKENLSKAPSAALTPKPAAEKTTTTEYSLWTAWHLPFTLGVLTGILILSVAQRNKFL